LAIANVQSTGASDGTGGVLTIAATFVSTPTVGNLITFNVLFFDGTGTAPTMTIDDGNGHSATVSATTAARRTWQRRAGLHKPTFSASSPAPARPGPHTFNKNTGVAAIWIDEFSGGTFSVDMATAFAMAQSNPAGTPTATVTGTDICSHVNSNSNAMFTFTAPWTGNTAGLFFSNGSAYAINRVANTAVSFNNSGGENLELLRDVIQCEWRRCRRLTYPAWE
jgi:hypothetical protein